MYAVAGITGQCPTHATASHASCLASGSSLPAHASACAGSSALHAGASTCQRPLSALLRQVFQQNTIESDPLQLLPRLWRGCCTTGLEIGAFHRRTS